MVLIFLSFSVTRVVNRYGPQTRREPMKPIKTEPTNTDVSPALEERLRNLETHLNIRSGTVA